MLREVHQVIPVQGWLETGWKHRTLKSSENPLSIFLIFIFSASLVSAPRRIVQSCVHTERNNNNNKVLSRDISERDKRKIARRVLKLIAQVGKNVTFRATSRLVAPGQPGSMIDGRKTLADSERQDVAVAFANAQRQHSTNFFTCRVWCKRSLQAWLRAELTALSSAVLIPRKMTESDGQIATQTNKSLANKHFKHAPPSSFDGWSSVRWRTVISARFKPFQCAIYRTYFEGWWFCLCSANVLYN